MQDEFSILSIPLSCPESSSRKAAASLWYRVRWLEKPERQRLVSVFHSGDTIRGTPYLSPARRASSERSSGKGLDPKQTIADEGGVQPAPGEGEIVFTHFETRHSTPLPSSGNLLFVHPITCYLIPATSAPNGIASVPEKPDDSYLVPNRQNQSTALSIPSQCLSPGVGSPKRMNSVRPSTRSSGIGMASL